MQSLASSSSQSQEEIAFFFGVDAEKELEISGLPSFL